MTIDGPVSVDIDKFISQPTEGLLYDLNKDRATILAFIDDIKWINDYAAMLTITKLKEHYDKHISSKLKKYYDFYDSVACLIAEGSEFMTKAELYDAVKREHGKVNKGIL